MDPGAAPTTRYWPGRNAGCGVRYGESVSVNSSSSGTAAAALTQVPPVQHHLAVRAPRPTRNVQPHVETDRVGVPDPQLDAPAGQQRGQQRHQRTQTGQEADGPAPEEQDVLDRLAARHRRQRPISLPSFSTSWSTISSAKPFASVSGFQPSTSRALVASPISASTSVGRSYAWL
jgi:hypothetical protein